MALAGAASIGFGKEPLSIQGISKEANNFEYNANIPLRYWLRAAEAIQKQAQAYDRDGNEQDAYLFYLRHAILLLENLSTHPDINLPGSMKGYNKATKDLKFNMRRMEDLKPAINARHEEYRKATARRKAEKEAWEKSQRSRIPAVQETDDTSLQDLVANTGRRQSKQEIHAENGGNHTVALSLVQNRKRKAEHDSSGTPLASRNWNYPSIPQKNTSDGLNRGARSSSPMQRSIAPHRPPKEYFGYGEPPPRPPKDGHMQGPPVPGKIHIPGDAEPISNDINSQDYTFKPTAKTEGGNWLRTVFINPDLRHQFLKIAQPNTTKNLETCGILCGVMMSNAFFITKLVIPEQTSTSDTCDTENEEALFEYCDSNDLMTLGWIHTHPSQTCFMSSRDMHTHSGYQVQMAESIAIVCAPRDQNRSVGVFRLTDPPGLKTVLNCNNKGIFHEHAVTNLYTDAMKPGHVVEVPGIEFEVVDMRPRGL